MMTTVQEDVERCKVCGGALQIELSRVPDVEGVETFDIRRCRDCGLGHTWPQPRDLRPYYHASYHGNRRGPAERIALRRRVAWAESVAPRGPGSALDIGCGDGTFLELLHQKEWQVAGTELDPRRARARGLSVAETVRDAARFGPFDLVTMWHTLEHFPDPLGILREVTRLLRPDGAVLIAVPNADGLQAKAFGPSWLHLDVPRHLFHFGPRSLQTLLAKAGLAPSERWDEELEYDVMGWAQSALAALGAPPRRFFDALRGRAAWGTAPLSSATHLAAGISLLPGAFLATKVATALRQGGTLVMAAHRAQGAVSN